uniref:GMP reductase n=1 Tax=Wuchereria bancrofti TaxID=6293 RepID=A0AAF5PKP1_WUCBA
MPRVEYEPKLDFKDVLLRPKRSTLESRADVDLVRELIFRNSKKKYVGIPVIASNMDTVGTFEIAEVLSKKKLFTFIHKRYSVEQRMEFVSRTDSNQDTLSQIGISSGVSDFDFAKLKEICELIPELQYICLDVANGYTEMFVDFIRRVREFPRHTIFAENVVTGEMIEELILSGVDVVKVDLGHGSVCTTLKKTGVGYPQLSAVFECADAAHGLNGHVVSDGRCTNPGDVAKAFGAGADFVMIGGLFAGHDQCGGDTAVKDGQKYNLFYGMVSDTAMKRHEGSVTEYRASEGKTTTLPCRLARWTTIACTHISANKLKELSKRATFVRVTLQTNEQYTTFKTSPSELQKLNIGTSFMFFRKFHFILQFCSIIQLSLVSTFLIRVLL